MSKDTTIYEEAMKAKKVQDLNYWLEEISVSEKDDHDPTVVTWWPDMYRWAVSHPDLGVFALFMNEKDAFRFRLDYINRQLNP